MVGWTDGVVVVVGWIISFYMCASGVRVSYITRGPQTVVEGLHCVLVSVHTHKRAVLSVAVCPVWAVYGLSSPSICDFWVMWKALVLGFVLTVFLTESEMFLNFV